ncbi:toxin secretion/phage lysis holin [Paenibacillus curdlanolyticus YK9]|uniref:Toxin secretion/phage lysis holin n=2 Tax=Paenibacillus curdlanolyticus TaxID=59840 RepID=E0IBV1_9BACL|nr:toxin secretion/phage lysis holin [Paenibacillus curdlanolyticus YK9]
MRGLLIWEGDKAMIKEYASTIYTAAVGSSGKEAAAGGIVAAAGIVISDLLGGWDKALQVLLWLMVFDYVTGVLGAFKTKTVNSDVMFWGGVRKATLLFVVGLATLLDDWLQPGAPIFRTAAIYFYIGREALSLVENTGVLGVPWPTAIKDKLEQLGGNNDANIGSGKK